jgi:hypothetical protein
MLTRIQTSLKGFFSVSRIPPGTIPWFIFGAAFFALGMLTLNLGFFQDDWNHVYAFSQGGFDAVRRLMFFDSRPLLHILFNGLFAVLVLKPFAWHLAVFIFRALGAIAFWAVLNKIWKGFSKENAIAALLFLLYPVFLLQPMALAFSIHWTLYFVYMLSVLLMLQAADRPRYFPLFVILSISLQVFHLLMIEYFIGIELLRPVFLWLVFRDQPFRERFKRTIFTWLPYLFINILYAIYRVSYSRIYGFERFGSMAFFDLLKQPLSLLAFYFRAGLQDFTEILLASWYETLKPALFDFSSLSRILIWALVLAAIFVVWSYLKLLRGEEHDPDSEKRWAQNMFWVGICAMLSGILPGWVVGNTVFGSNPLWNDRFAMAAMFGAGMVWTGVIFLFISKPNHRYLIFSILISLAIGINLRTQLNFKYAWEKQLNFYWQLSWRAPYIEPHTLLISDGEFLSYMGTSPTSFALNTLYPQSLPLPQVGYWMSNGPERLPDWDEFRSGTVLDFQRYASTFTGNTADSITISFLPEEDQCLWILPPEYESLRFLTPGTLQSLPVSSLERIQAEPLDSWSPPSQIFGPEPKHSWCYYFQKGDLAAQFEDWNQVVILWKEAQAKEIRPGHGLEYFPFIRAYAFQDDWDSALQLTIQSSKTSLQMNSALCKLWAEMQMQTPESAARAEAMRAMQERYNCVFPNE